MKQPVTRFLGIGIEITKDNDNATLSLNRTPILDIIYTDDVIADIIASHMTSMDCDDLVFESEDQMNQWIMHISSSDKI